MQHTLGRPTASLEFLDFLQEKEKGDTRVFRNFNFWNYERKIKKYVYRHSLFPDALKAARVGAASCLKLRFKTFYEPLPPKIISCTF